MSSRLELNIPEQVEADKSSLFLQPKELKAWVDALPWANIGEISRHVYKGLIDFNRTRVPQRDAMMGAEQFRKPVNYVTRSLEKHYLDTGFPLSKRNQKIANLTHELNCELAIAYKAVIKRYLRSSRVDKTDKKLLVIALYRAIYYLSKVIVQKALVYESCPTHIWQEIHGLYHYARRHGLDTLQVKVTSSGGEEHSSSIQNAYKRILMFNLASPMRLRQREIHQLYAVLEDWSRYAVIRDTVEKSDPENQFLVVVEKDAPPIHISLAKDEISNSSASKLIIDTTELINKLNEIFSQESEQITTGMPAGIMSNALRRRLMQTWSSAPHRKFARTKLNFELTVAVGLMAIHSLLEEEEAAYDADMGGELEADMNWLDQQADSDGFTGVSLKSRDLSAAFSLAPIEKRRDVRREGFEEFGPNSHDEIEPEPVVPIWGNTGEKDDVTYETYSFQTINESAGGYCLDWHGPPPVPPVKVGELIGIQSTSIAGQYGVAVIRWIQTSGEHGLQVGVQMLAPNALPVTVGKEAQQKALLLPETGDATKQSSLVTFPHPFNVGNDLIIEERQSIRPIKLTRMAESTGAFSLFQFSYMDLDDEDGKGDGKDDFDNIWSTL